MSRTTAILLAAAMTAPVWAQDNAAPAEKPAETMQRVAISADAELAKSVAELNRLREQIAADKLPLAQELTALEERLVQLRKENDRITRLVDEGALGMAAMRSEIKLRQDELTYLGNLFDEYARGFEQRLNIGEGQVMGEAIEKAKLASETKELTQPQKFERQTNFVDLSISRLFEAVGGMKFPGTGVDENGAVSQGEFALVGPISLFRAATGAAGIAMAQVGSPNPVVRPLEGELQTQLSTLVASGEGDLPLDPSRGGALKALVAKTNLVDLFIKGGPIMWPILAASILALATVLERVLFLLNEQRKRDSKALKKFFVEVNAGNIEAAIEVSHRSKDCVVRTIGYALEHRDFSLDNAIDYAQGREMKRFRRGIAILDTVITLAPLLGLLGTVTGMMGSFSVIGGDLSSPGAITGGIAEALIATAAGLLIAIMCLLPFNYLNAKIEVIEHDISSAASQLKLLIEKREAQLTAAQALAAAATVAAAQSISASGEPMLAGRA